MTPSTKYTVNEAKVNKIARSVLFI